MLNDGVMRLRLPSLVEASVSRAFARVEVHRDATMVLEAWARFEADGLCPIYQTRAWLLPWIETLGRQAGIVPLFILARARDESPVALLCLGIERSGPFRVATFLGGKDSNLNMPLVRPDIRWTSEDLTAMFDEAALAMGRERPDAFILANQPFSWNERANPLALLPGQPSPSAAYGTALPPEAETLFAAKLSKDTRKKLRKKEARLATFGAISHRVATTPADQAMMIDTFLALKIARFEAQAIPSEFATPAMRAFIETASAPHGDGIELHALKVGDRIVALYGGAAAGGQWSGMFNAFDPDPEIAKSSPGDLLLMKVIEKACADGLNRFDLGIGEARYKAALCDETIPLFDALVATSLRGRVFVRLHALRQAIKRKVKADPRLFALAKRLRRGTIAA